MIRASTKQRTSLLRTLDAEYTVREDMDVRQGFEDPPPGVKPVLDIHWASDRGRILLEVSRGALMDRLFYDGAQSIRMIPDMHDPAILDFVSIVERPPDIDDFGPVILPHLLGLTDQFVTGDVETVLASEDARIDTNWAFTEGNSDVSVTCPSISGSKPTVHLGFDSHRGLALSVRQFEYSSADYAAWVVDDWMTVESELTGETVAVPARGHSVTHSVTSGGIVHHQVIFLEMHRFELPREIARGRFVPTIPPGTEVWSQSEIPGQPARRSIAGGATAINLQAREAARGSNAAMAELRNTGVIFSGRPQPSNWSWPFVLLGILCIGGGLLWRRKMFRNP